MKRIKSMNFYIILFYLICFCNFELISVQSYAQNDFKQVKYHEVSLSIPSNWSQLKDTGMGFVYSDASDKNNIPAINLTIKNEKLPSFDKASVKQLENALKTDYIKEGVKVINSSSELATLGSDTCVLVTFSFDSGSYNNVSYDAHETKEVYVDANNKIYILIFTGYTKDKVSNCKLFASILKSLKIEQNGLNERSIYNYLKWASILAIIILIAVVIWRWKRNKMPPGKKKPTKKNIEK